MTTSVFLTVDVEFAWRHYAAGYDVDTIYARSIEPAGVGLSFQLAQLARHGLKACFFVDPMPALVFGIDPVRRMVETILAAGQEVQLHIHPNWRGADASDRKTRYGRFQLHEYGADEQRALLVTATELLVAAGRRSRFARAAIPRTTTRCGRSPVWASSMIAATMAARRRSAASSWRRRRSRR
jgi:hypothetical protein